MAQIYLTEVLLYKNTSCGEQEHYIIRSCGYIVKLNKTRVQLEWSFELKLSITVED